MAYFRNVTLNIEDFETTDEYERALIEQERIQKILSNVDITDAHVARQLYEGFVQHPEMFRSIVGKEFMGVLEENGRDDNIPIEQFVYEPEEAEPEQEEVDSSEEAESEEEEPAEETESESEEEDPSEEAESEKEEPVEEPAEETESESEEEESSEEAESEKEEPVEEPAEETESESEEEDPSEEAESEKEEPVEEPAEETESESEKEELAQETVQESEEAVSENVSEKVSNEMKEEIQNTVQAEKIEQQIDIPSDSLHMQAPKFFQNQNNEIKKFKAEQKKRKQQFSYLNIIKEILIIYSLIAICFPLAGGILSGILAVAGFVKVWGSYINNKMKFVDILKSLLCIVLFPIGIILSLLGVMKKIKYVMYNRKMIFYSFIVYLVPVMILCNVKLINSTAAITLILPIINAFIKASVIGKIGIILDVLVVIILIVVMASRFADKVMYEMYLYMKKGLTQVQAIQFAINLPIVVLCMFKAFIDGKILNEEQTVK